MFEIILYVLFVRRLASAFYFTAPAEAARWRAKIFEHLVKQLTSSARKSAISAL
jgi:hypothetical protein